MNLVFDIGGTNTRVAISEDGKSLKSIKKVFTPGDFDQGMKGLKQVADQLSGGKKIKGVVVGVAGPLDKEKTTLVASPHIRGWVNKPLKPSLEKIFNQPVYLEHEADLEGLGEVAFGAGQGYKIVANLVIGTGVATTRIIDGKIDQNALGFEAGHQIIVINGHPCDCGGFGHLEAYVSGSGLMKTYGKKGQDLKDPKIWEEVAKYLAIGLNNVAVFWSPEVIVLGGAVMQSIPIETVKSYFKEVLTIFPAPPRVVLGKLGDDSALFGGLRLLME